MVSAWPVSGLARPAAASHPLSALAAPGTSASPPGLTHLQQQRKLLSIQSEDNHEPSEELGVAAAEEGPAAEGPAAEEWVEEEQQVEEEPGGSISSSQSPYLVQVDGLPFAMRQEEIQQWFAEAGPAPVKTTVPMWSDKSSRAGYSKGRAYLQFDSEEDTKAVLALTGKAIGERWVSITRLAIPLEAVRRKSRGARGTMRCLRVCSRFLGGLCWRRRSAGVDRRERLQSTLIPTTCERNAPLLRLCMVCMRKASQAERQSCSRYICMPCCTGPSTSSACEAVPVLRREIEWYGSIAVEIEALTAVEEIFYYTAVQQLSRM